MDTLAVDLSTMTRIPLAETHVRALRNAGRQVRFAAGQTIIEMGTKQADFLYLLEGEAAAYTADGQLYSPHTLGPTQFVGEIAFLYGGASLLNIRALKDSVFIAVERATMLDLMARIPEMSDIVVMVFAGRRRALIERNASLITLLGADVDRDIGRIAAFASRNRLPYRSLALDTPEAAELARACALDGVRPAAVYGAGTLIDDPTPRTVAALLGLDLAIDSEEAFDVIIVGGGPAGIAAGVYAGAEGLKALVLEDMTIGGQAGTSSRIENFMGFPTGISGADLCWRGEVQAIRLGTRFAMPRRACGLSRDDDGLFTVSIESDKRVRGRAVVISTGVQYRRLSLDRLEDFEGAGVYYAATEIEARRCRDAEVVVIGGGNSAGQAAMFLSRSATHVHMLVRGSSLAASMSAYLSGRIEQNPAITVHFRSQVTALHGSDRLEAVTVQEGVSGEQRRIPAGGMFAMIGAAPNTGWLQDLVALDERGFVLTGPDVGGRSTYETSVPGIFAVGDVRAGSTKRVASGVGEGSVVIAQVWSHVRDERSH